MPPPGLASLTVDTVDVLVVGAGLAGLHTARLLAAQGFDVLVVDRRRSLSVGIRTTGIFVRRTLDDFDLPDHVLGPGVRDVLLYPPSRRSPVRLTSDRDEYRVTDAHVRNARHGYYAMISYVDRKFGELLAALQTTGLADDTVVVVTADHGDMLGERGLWYKMTFFERAARVPLILHAPRLFAARRVPQSVSLVDLLPTFADLAGESAPFVPKALLPAAPPPACASHSSSHPATNGAPGSGASPSPRWMAGASRWLAEVWLA